MAAYYGSVIAFAVDFPISDDIALLEFLLAQESAVGSVPLHQALMAKHNEHILATTRVVFLAYGALPGPINFVGLCLIGSLFLLPVFWVLWRLGPGRDGRLFSALLVCCLIFQYGAAESMLWAMAAISNYSVIAFALLSLYALSTGSGAGLIAGLVLAGLCLVTQGNGLLLPLLAAAYLVAERRFFQAVPALLLAIAGFWLYFAGGAPAVGGNLSGLLAQGPAIVLFALAFIGSCLGIGGSHYPLVTTISLVPTVSLGLLVCAVTAYGLLRPAEDRRRRLLIWINLFVIGTALLTALSRYDYGLSQALISRYKIYANIGLIATALYLLDTAPVQTWLGRWRGRRGAGLAAYLPLAYPVLSFALVLLFSFKIYGPSRHGQVVHPRPAEAYPVLERAIERGLVNPGFNRTKDKR